MSELREHDEPVRTKVDPEALSSLDNIARRLRLYSVTIVAVGVVLGSAISWVVLRATSGVRTEIAAVSGEITAVKVQMVRRDEELARRADADSARFERGMQVLELTVVALIEPAGSKTREEAVATLRGMRRVTAR